MVILCNTLELSSYWQHAKIPGSYFAAYLSSTNTSNDFRELVYNEFIEQYAYIYYISKMLIVHMP